MPSSILGQFQGPSEPSFEKPSSSSRSIRSYKKPRQILQIQHQRKRPIHRIQPRPEPGVLIKQIIIHLIQLMKLRLSRLSSLLDFPSRIRYRVKTMSETLHTLEMVDLVGLQLLHCIALVVLASSQNLLLYRPFCRIRTSSQ
jgi:hypothetical protein